MKTLLRTFQILLLLLQLPVAGMAQSITVGGHVSGKRSALPLDSAVVEVTGLSTGVRQSAATNSSGQWIMTIAVSGVRESPVLPAGVALQQNYPNPFNPSTRIGFSIAKSGPVRLAVYNVLGQVVASRVTSLTPGGYQVEWRSRGPAGVLLYVIEANGVRLVGKMIQLDGGGAGGFGDITAQTTAIPNASAGKLSAGTYRIVAGKLGYVDDTTFVTLADGVQTDFSLTTVHDAAYVIDLHNDVLEKIYDGYDLGPRHTFNHTDLPRLREGGMDLQVMAMWADPAKGNWYSRTIAMADSFDSQRAKYSDQMGQVRTSADLPALAAAGKIGALLTVEGGHSIEDDTLKLLALFNRGMRIMTITWNNSTSWAVSAADARSQTVGLNDFGRGVIRLLDSLGVIIDVSHTGIRTIQDILAVTHNPIIASHSGARALRDHTRNLTDAQIRSIAAVGGVIGVVFYPTFLSSRPGVNIDTVMRHIDYIKNLVGVDYVALGSDFDGIETTPVGLEDVSKLPALTMAMLKRGYAVSDVRKILGENFLRVLKRVCDKAPG